MAADVIIIIDEPKVTAMVFPGGMVWKWALQRNNRIEVLATDLAPMRSGKLRRSIKGKWAGSTPSTVRMEVSANTHYAVYVHQGTSGDGGEHRLRGRPGPISHGLWQPGEAPGGRWPKFTKKGVAGIGADPFLEDALNTVMGDVIGRSLGLRRVGPRRHISRRTRLGR